MAEPNGSLRSDGNLDQVRIFDKALSSSEVTTLYGESNTSTTKSKTDIFDDGSGVALYEFEKGAKDTGGVSGYIGSAGIFNGSSSGITTSLNNNLFTNGYQFSVSMWVNPSTSQTHASLINGLVTSSTGWLIELNNNRIYTNVTQSGPAYRRGYFNTTLNNGQWYHIAVDLINNYAYLNGQDISNTFVDDSYGTISSIVDADWKIGTQTATNTYYFNGKIDQVRIFNKALSSSEVTTLYGETSASATKSTTDVFDDGSGIALYELEGNANDTGDTYNGTATNVSYAYNGTPTNVNFLGMAFQPDFVWIKSRSNATNNELHDSLRGEPSRLFSDATNAEMTVANGFVSLDSNGFSLDGTGDGGEVNFSGRTYVAWCWKAGSSAASNTDGSITSTVSANTDAGFSIVKYDGATNATTDTSNNGGSYWNVGHGLSSPPEMVIVKKTNNVGSWYVGALDGWTVSRHLILNATAAQVDGSGAIEDILWGNQNPTSTTFGLGGWDVVNRNGDSYIAYCFHSVDGYQKVGSYSGGSSGSGNIIETGFKPRYVMLKVTNVSGEDWHCFDSVRGGGDTFVNDLRPNTSEAESTFAPRQINFVDNGFYWTGTEGGVNGSGRTYIYLAIA